MKSEVVVLDIEYKTLEQQIQELWQSRGMEVETISFRYEKGYGIWTIKAKSKGEI